MVQVWSSTQINSHLTGGGTTTVTQSGGTVNDGVYGSEGVSSPRKVYWETQLTTSDPGGNATQGIGNVNSSTADFAWQGEGTDTVGFTVVGDGSIRVLYNSTTQYIVTGLGASQGDRFAHALDMSNGTYWWNDVTVGSGWYGSSTTTGNPATNAGGFNIQQTGATITNSAVVPGISLYASGDVGNGYFAPATWQGSAPAGFWAFDVILGAVAFTGAATLKANVLQPPGIVPPVIAATGGLLSQVLEQTFASEGFAGSANISTAPLEMVASQAQLQASGTLIPAATEQMRAAAGWTEVGNIFGASSGPEIFDAAILAGSGNLSAALLESFAPPIVFLPGVQLAPSLTEYIPQSVLIIGNGGLLGDAPPQQFDSAVLAPSGVIMVLVPAPGMETAALSETGSLLVAALEQASVQGIFGSVGALNSFGLELAAGGARLTGSGGVSANVVLAGVAGSLFVGGAGMMADAPPQQFAGSTLAGVGQISAAVPFEVYGLFAALADVGGVLSAASEQIASGSVFGAADNLLIVPASAYPAGLVVSGAGALTATIGVQFALVSLTAKGDVRAGLMETLVLGGTWIGSGVLGSAVILFAEPALPFAGAANLSALALKPIAVGSGLAGQGAMAELVMGPLGFQAAMVAAGGLPTGLTMIELIAGATRLYANGTVWVQLGLLGPPPGISVIGRILPVARLVPVSIVRID